jgi:Sulfatase/HEAT repeats
MEAAWFDAAAVTAVWGVMVLVEALVVSLLWIREFSASWEIVRARRLVGTLAFAELAPVSILVVGGFRLVRLARQGRRLARGALALLGAAAAAALGLGVSAGRHFASWGVRGPFVGALVLAGAAAGALMIPRAAAIARRSGGLASLGLAALVAAWLADVFVLPRLYPAFHLALFVATLLAGALVALAARSGSGSASASATWLGRAAGGVVVAVVAVCAVRAPAAASALQRFSNIRIILVEHAPILGRAVQVTEALRPEERWAPWMDAPSVAPGEVVRSLDWTGHDIVLITVDALRADHVSAYGYARPTTPNLDALAREGTLFDAAYCPTPHTSYSLTSMMTGKYLRPLLALGLGQDSETWAQHLRRYGWRTAAFYPPAVFFIDEERFPRFEETRMGFEYAKVEFADPPLREAQVAQYLEGATGSLPLFLWVHFFEPHEPYVVHPEHLFTGGRSADEDAYDGEIATADDGIGRITRLVRARRPGAVVIVTADHGEEFGEHGGRYHGTTVYEEQVRVPLVVVGPGVRPGAHVATVVQTIDLLPTALSALGIPRPARVRGRDLGPALASDTRGIDGGLAFAETGDYALVASGPDRLICERRAAACALYRPADDRSETHDVASSQPARFDELRGMLRSIERDHGRYEGGGGPSWPEALRRGMQGDAEAATDVASLLDDADVTLRRKAGEVSYALHAASTAPQLRRALARDEDDEVRRWSALALARAAPGDPPPAMAEALMKDGLREWRRRAALALGERGDPRACEEIASWWASAAPPPGPEREDGEPARLALDVAAARELLGATAHARCRTAVPALLRAAEDVSARPYVADTLGGLGDDRARAPLRALLETEPYVTTRPHEARALLALGVRDWSSPDPSAAAHVILKSPPGPLRLLVLLSDASATLDGEVDGEPLVSPHVDGEVRSLQGIHRSGPPVTIDLRASKGAVVALWLAPPEAPPMPPDLIEKPGWRK